MITKNEKVQRVLGGSFFERTWLWIISKVQFLLLGAHKDKNDVTLLKQIRKERVSMLTAYESYTILSTARSVKDLAGDMAEVGVFKGASAKILCGLKGDKALFLFDTFAGLPANAANTDEAELILADRQYSFVHFDVDLYEGTKACLEYYYPRMVSGGIMLSHDYSLLRGVKQAFDEFVSEIPEGLIEFPSTQCMIVKR
jgi:O-methyltransferase